MSDISSKEFLIMVNGRDIKLATCLFLRGDTAASVAISWFPIFAEILLKSLLDRTWSLTEQLAWTSLITHELRMNITDKTTSIRNSGQHTAILRILTRSESHTDNQRHRSRTKSPPPSPTVPDDLAHIDPGDRIFTARTLSGQQSDHWWSGVIASPSYWVRVL